MTVDSVRSFFANFSRIWYLERKRVCSTNGYENDAIRFGAVLQFNWNAFGCSWTISIAWNICKNSHWIATFITKCVCHLFVCLWNFQESKNTSPFKRFYSHHVGVFSLESHLNRNLISIRIRTVLAYQKLAPQNW